MLPRWLSGGGYKPPSPFHAGMEEFLSLDIERLAKRLELDTKAKQRGGKNLPPPEQENPDDVELAIESEISNFARKAHAALTDYLRAFRDRASPILGDDASDRIRSIAQSATTGMFAQVRTGTGILFSAKRDLAQAHQDLTEFRQRHELVRPASYPDSRFLLLSLLALLLVIESAANAVLIGEASEFGILGGFAEMIGISFINLTVGFAAGRFLMPQLSRKDQASLVFFGLLLVVVIATIFGFNLFVGHYRDVLAVSASDLGIVDFGARAVQRLKEAPFGLQDFKSWVFMFLGLIFSSFAMGDGFKMDDRYPGYGAKDRLHKRLVDTYGRHFERLQNELERLADSGIAQINEVAERAGYSEQELKSITDRISGLREKLEAYYTQLERDGQQLTQRYRQGNLAARQSPPPKYFNTPFRVPIDDRRNPNIELAEPPDTVTVKTAAGHARKSVGDMHRQLLDVYKTIDQLTEEETQTARPDRFLERVSELESKPVGTRDETPPAEAAT